MSGRRRWPVRFHEPRHRRGWPVLVAGGGSLLLLLAVQVAVVTDGVGEDPPPVAAATAAPATPPATPTAAPPAAPPTAPLPSVRQTAARTAPTPDEEPALRVDFGPGDVTVTPGDEARLGALASRVAAGEVPGLTVTGYAEPSGDAVLEEQLALGRARAVAQVLLDAGVPAGALRVDGAGATGPRGAGRFVLVAPG